MITLVACLATFTCCCPTIASPHETLTQKTEVIQLACFRRLITASASFKDIHPGPLIFVCVDRRAKGDPSASIMNALQLAYKNIRPMSKGVASVSGVKEKGSKLTGVMVWVDNNFKSTDKQAIVTGGVFVDGKAARGIRLHLLRNKDNTWRVANTCRLWVS